MIFSRAAEKLQAPSSREAPSFKHQRVPQSSIGSLNQYGLFESAVGFRHIRQSDGSLPIAQASSESDIIGS